MRCEWQASIARAAGCSLAASGSLHLQCVLIKRPAAAATHPALPQLFVVTELAPGGDLGALLG